MPSIGSYTNQNANISTSLTKQVKSLTSGNIPPTASTIASKSSLSEAQLTRLTQASQLSIASLTAGSVSSLLNTVVNPITSLANSAVSSLTDLKPPMSDPISSSLSGMSNTGSSASTFITSPMNAQITPIDFSNNSATSAVSLSQQNPNQIAALSSRYGVSAPVSDRDLNNLQSMSFSNTSATLLGAALSPTIIAAVPGVTTSVSSSPYQSAFVQQYSSQYPGVSSAPTILANNWNSSYPLVANPDGSYIPGIPTDTDPSLLSSLSAILHNACTEFVVPIYSPYAMAQSFLDATISLILGNNLMALFNEIALCANLMNNETRRTAARQLPALAGAGNAALAASVVTTVGGSMVSGAKSLITSLCGNSVTEPTAATSVTSIMSETNQTPTDIFGSGSFGNDTVWDSNSIGNANSSIMNTLVGNDVCSMSDMSSAIPLY